MKTIKIFLPLLFFYGFIIIAFSPDEFVYDEGRYIKFATYLSEGHYSPRDRIDLTNGPGYPLLLLPFLALKIPLFINVAHKKTALASPPIPFLFGQVRATDTLPLLYIIYALA